MALEPTKGQEQINQQTDPPKERTRLNFVNSIFAGASLGKINEAEVSGGIPAEMPTFDEFQSTYKDKIPEEQHQEYYDHTGKLFELYKAIDKSTLDINHYTFPDIEYFAGDEYPKDVLDKKYNKSKVPMSDRFFHTASGNKIELYSQDLESTNKNIFFDKDDNIKPMVLSEYADNYLKLQKTEDGRSYWREAQDDEMIPADQIRKYWGGDRTLETSNIFKSAIKGLWSGSAPIVAQGVGTGYGSLMNLGDQFLSNVFDYDFRPEERGYYKFNAKAQNWANMQSAKNYDEMESMFVDANAGIFQITNIMTQMIGMIASGLTFGSVSKLLGAGTTWSQTWGTTAAKLLGSFEAGSAFQDQLVAQGVDFNRASQYLIPFMTTTYLTETLGGGFIEKAGGRLSNKIFSNKFSEVELNKLVNKEIDNLVFKTGKELRQLSVKQQKTFVGKTWKKIQNASIAAHESSKGKAFTQGLTRSLKGAGSESFEEITEGIAHTYISMIVNGREAVLGERYLNLHDNYNYTPIDPDNPEQGYQRISKTDPTDTTELSYGEYQDHVKYTNHFNDVLNGVKTLDTSFNIAEDGVSTFIGVFLTGGFGNAIGVLSPAKYKEESKYSLANMIVKDPKQRDKIEKTLLASIKNNTYSGVMDSKDLVNTFMSEIDLSVELLNTIKNDEIIHNAIRGKESLLKQAYMAKVDSKKHQAKLNSLQSLSSTLEQGPLEEDNVELGLKAGTTKAEVDALIETETKLLQVADNKYKHVTDPEKSSELVFDENNKGTRKQLDKAIFYGKPTQEKKTSKGYSEMLFNALAVDHVLKSKAEENVRKSLNLKPNETSKKFYDELEKTLPGHYLIGQAMMGNVLEGFKGQRDTFLEALKAMSIRAESSRKNAFKAFRSPFTEGTEEGLVSGGVQSKIDEVLKPLNDMFSGLGEGKSIYDDINNIKPFQEGLDSAMNLMGQLKGLAGTLNPGSQEGQDVAKALQGLQALPSMIQQGAGDVSDAQGMQTYLTNVNSGLLGIEEEFNKPLDERDVYNDPTDKQKLDALNDLIFEGFTSVNNLFETASKEALGLGQTHDQIQAIIDDYQKVLDGISTYIELNTSFIQGKLESNNDSSQHSPLIDNDNARLNKNIQDQWKEFTQQEQKKIDTINEKIKELTADKAVNNFKSEVSNLNLDYQLFNSILLFYKKGYTGSKEVQEIIEKSMGKIEKFFESKLANGEPIKDFNNLLRSYLTSEEGERIKLTEILHTIENEILEMKQELSQKVDGLITWLNSKTPFVYNESDPLDDHKFFDRTAEQLKETVTDEGGTNKGFMTTQTWASGFDAFFSKRRNTDEINHAKFFYQHTINTLNEINTFGIKGIPTIKDVFYEIRDIVRETPNGENENTYEQEKMLLSIISFLYSPSNEYIRQGINNSNKPQIKVDKINRIIDNILFAKGYGGTGKTWLMLNVIKAYSKLNPGTKLSVTIVVPSSGLIKVHDENLETVKDFVEINYILLHDVISGNKTVVDQDIVIADEGTVIPVGQEENMKEKVRDSHSNWIFLGDDVQTTPFTDITKATTENPNPEVFEVRGEEYFLSMTARFTLPLTEVFRTNLVEFSVLQEKVREAKFKIAPKEALDSFLNYPTEYKVTQDGKGKLGIEYFENGLPDPAKNALIDEFLRFVDPKDGIDKGGKETFLIFLTNEDLEAALKEKSQLKDYQLKTVEYDLLEILKGQEERADRLVSGLQINNAFVAIDFRKHPKFKNPNKLMLRSFLVSTTRQKKYLALVGDSSISKMIPQDQSDDKIHAFKDNKEFSLIHKQYLIGTDVEGTGGRYSFLLKDEQGFNGTQQPSQALDETIDRTLRLDATKGNNASYKVKTATSKKAGELRNNKPKGTRLSDMFFNIEGTFPKQARMTEKELIATMKNQALEQAERDSAAKVLESTKLHKLFNLGINYAITQIEEPDLTKDQKTKAKKLESMKKDIFEIYDFMNEHFVYGYENYDALLSKLVKTISLQPDVSLQISDGLAIPAPYVVSEVNGTTYTTQPNLLTIVGYATVNNKKVPIVDVHLYKYRHIKDIFESDMTHIGGQLALLANEGFKVNNVTVHNYTLDFTAKVSKMEHVQRIQLTSDQVVDALNEANLYLKIEGTIAQNNAQEPFIFDKSIIATDQEFGKESRMLPEHKGITGGMSVVYKGKIKEIDRLTTQLVNGKREVTVHIDGKKITFDQFLSKYIKNESKPNSTWHKSTAEKHATEQKVLWGTTMGVVISDELLSLIPKTRFFEVTGENKNELLELKQLVIKHLNKTAAYKLVVHKTPLFGINVESFGENNVKTNYSLQDDNAFKYPISVEFTGTPKDADMIVKRLLEKEEVLNPLLALANKHGITYTDNVDLFKKMGMDKLGFLGEVEYDYHTKLSEIADAKLKEDLINKANAYIRSSNLTNEKAQEDLEEIFKDAFMGNELNVDNLDEIGTNARRDLIVMNKARMELLRELYNSDEPLTVNISELGNGSVILNKKDSPTGKIPNKVYTVQEVIDNSNLYGFEVETENGELVLDWEKGVNTERTRIFAKAWRTDKANPATIFFDGKETVPADYDHFINELESLSKSEELINLIKTYEEAEPKSSEFKESFLKAINLIETSEFVSFLNTNKKNVLALAERIEDINSRIAYDRGRIYISSKSPKNAFSKAIALARYMRDIETGKIPLSQEQANRVGFYLPDTSDKAIFYQPVFLSEKDANGKRTINRNNIRSAFKTLSQPEMWIRYEPSIALNKEATGEDTVTLIPKEQVNEELIKIFGKHIYSKLFWRKGAFLSGDTKVWGRVYRGMMTLAEIDNGYSISTIHKHEAIHMLLLHVVDPTQTNKILLAAEKELISKGVAISKSKSERLTQLHEYLADQYEERANLTNTFLDKFINWIRWAVAKITGGTINEFFLSVDRGAYVNQSFQYNNHDVALNKKVVKNKYNSPEALANLIKVFGNINAVNQIRSTKLAHKWFSYSPYGMDFSISKTNWKETLERVQEALMFDQLRVQHNRVIITDDKGKVEKTKVMEMTPGQYEIASTEQRDNRDNIEAADLYETYHLGDNFIAKSMYQRLFIDMNIELIESGVSDETGVRRQEAFNVANELKNPLHSETSYFQFLIGSVPLYEYLPSGIKPIPNKYINFRFIDARLTQTYLTLKMDGSSPTFSEVMHKMAQDIGIKGEDIVPDTILKNNIYSFLRYFGHLQDPQRTNPTLEDGVLKGVGLASLLEDPESVIDWIDVDDKQFNDKVDALIGFKNLLHRYYDSLRHNIISYVDFTNPQARLEIRHGFSKKSIKSGLNDTSDMAMLGPEGDLRPEIIEELNDTYQVSQKGVTGVIGGTVSNLINVNDFTATTMDDALSMYKFLGFDAVTPEILSYLQRNKKWETTVRGLYNMMFTAKVAADISKDIQYTNDNDIEGQGVFWSPETEENITILNKNYNKNYTSGNLVDTEEINKYQNEGTAEEVTKLLPLPSDHWKFIEDVLASAISLEISSMTSTRHRKATGTMSHAFPLSSYLFDIFPQKMDSSTVLTTKIRNKLTLLQPKNHTLVNDKSQDSKVKAKYNNPMLNNRMVFDFVQLFDGIKVVNKASDYDKITEFDLIKTIIEGYYIPELSKTGRVKKTYTFSDTLSSKSTMPIYNWTVNKKGEQNFIVKAKGGKLPNKMFDLIMDKGTVGDMVYDIARYYEKLAKTDKTAYPLTTKNNPYLAVLSSLRNDHGKVDTIYQNLQKAFLGRYMNFLDVLEENGYTLPENVSGKYHIEATKEEKGLLNNGEWADHPMAEESMFVEGRHNYLKKDGSWHPLLEVVFWSHAILNESLSHLIRGPQAMYGKSEANSVTDYIKRAGIIAPGKLYSMESDSTLPEESRVIVLRDPVVANKLFGGNVEALDGSSWLMPWYHKALKYAGGAELNTIGNGAIKNVNFNYDPVTLDLHYIKFAQFPITPSQYDASDYLQQMVTMSLGEVGNMEYLGSTWNDRFTKDYASTSEMFYNWLKTPQGKANRGLLVDYIVYKSAFKVGLDEKKLQGTQGDFNEIVINDPKMSSALNKDDNIVTISNKTLRHQTITQQSTEDQFAPIPTQLLFIVGALSHNNVRIRDINTALALILKEGNDKLEEGYNDDYYLNQIGSDYARYRGLMNKFGSLIANAKIDINLFRDNLFTALSTEMQKYTTPELPGLSFVQAPSVANLFWKDGVAYYPSELKNKSEEEMKLYTRRPLKPISYKDGKFIPMEVITPFHNATKFGIKRDMTLAKAMTLSDGGKPVNMNIPNSENIEDLEKKVNSKLEGLHLQKAFYNMSESQKKIIRHPNIKSFSRYFVAFNQSLDIISVRIPTSNASTASVGRIVAFDFDADNTIFISSEKNIIDGSDYDIDALRVFFRNITYGLETDQHTVATSQNAMFQSIVEYYNEIKNKPMIIQAITYKNIKDEAAKKMKDRNLYSNDFGSMVNSFEYSMAGAELAGHFPNLENFLFRIWSLTNEKRNNVLASKYEDQFNDKNIVEISKLIASLINAAVDNENLGGALGILNINTTTSPLISGMIFSGLTESEIIEALNDEELKVAAKKVKRSTNLTASASTTGNSRQGKKARIYDKINPGELKDYAYIGEALRRMGNIVSLQRKLPATLYEFNAKINQIENTLGVSLDQFLDPNFEKTSVADQIEFVKKQPDGESIVYQDEFEIRNVIDMQELFLSDEMINFRYLLGIIRNMSIISNKFTIQGNKKLNDLFFMKTGQKGFTYENQYKDFANAVDNQLVGLFISYNFKDVKLNNESYNLSKLRKRFEFVSHLPDYLRGLKKSDNKEISGNAFIQGLKIEKKFGNSTMPIVQFPNSIYLSEEDYVAYQRTFKALDKDIQDVFNAYQLLISGFNYRNGSLIEVISENNEKEYSKWFDNFEDTLENDLEALEEFVDRLIRVDKKLAQKIRKGKDGWGWSQGQEYGNYEKDNSKEPILLRNQGSGDPKYINGINSNLFNSYTEDNHETTYVTFNNITQEQIDTLNKGKDVPIKLWKTVVKSGMEMGEDTFTNDIISGNVVKIPNGQLIQILKPGRNNAILTMDQVKQESKIEREQSAVAYQFIEPFIKKIQQVFPNIKINLVDNERMGGDNTIAWIEKGEVFLNTDRIQLDTPIHEFIGHIMIDLIDSTNPTLFKSLYAEALELLNSTNGQLIKEHYSNLSQTDLIREVIANMMGWASEDKVLSFLMKTGTENALPNSKSLYSRIKNFAKGIRKSIMDWINRAFGTRLNLKNVETASIGDIARSVVDAIVKGDVISYVSSRQFSKLQRMAKYESRIKKDTVKNMDSLYTMLNDNIRTREERANILQAQLRMADSNVFKDSIFGEIKQVNPESREDILKAIDAQDAFAGEFSTKVVDWLSEGGDLVQKATVFGVTEHGNPIFRDMDNFIHQIEYNRATKYMKYSELKDNATFKHLYNSDFVSKDFDPIIAIEAATEDMVNISIYDITPIPVGYNAEKDNILVELIPKNISAKLKGVTLTNDETGLRQLMSGLLLNHMMGADKTVSVDNVKFIELKKSKSQDHTIDPIAITNTIKAMGEEKEFINSISNEGIKGIFRNPKYTAHTDYFKTLKSFYQDAPPEKTWEYGLRAVLENESLTPKERYTVLAWRLKAVTGLLDETNVDKFTTHQIKELKYLTGAIMQVRKSLSHDSQANPFTGLTKLEKMIFNSNAVGDENIQALKRIIYTSSNRIVELMNREKHDLNKLYIEARNIYGNTSAQRVRQISQDVWDSLFVKMKDKNGVEYNTGYIYWTKNENDVTSDMQKKMARQALEMNIPDNLLEIGRKITEKVEEYVKKSMLNEKLNGASTNSFWNFKARRAYTLEDIDLSETMYERGMMPIMARTPGEQFAALSWNEIGGAIGKKFKVIGDVYELFDMSLAGAEARTTDYIKLDDMFKFQWGGTGKNQNTANRTPLGYSGRVNGLVGIKTTANANGVFELELVDKKKNDDISKNINLVMESFMMSVMRSEEYENHVLPVMNGLKVYMKDQADHTNDPAIQNKLQNTIDYVNLYTKQGIKGERQKMGSGNILPGVDFDALLMGSMAIARPAVMTLNFNIGMIGLVTNSMFAFMEGISNQFVERGIFNAGELTKASGLFFSNPGKTRQLVSMYQVMNKTEEDVLRHQTQRIEQTNIFTEFWSNSLNWGADYYARSVIMIAQMLHDGSWDAHVFDGPSGKIEKFDQTIDKRFNTGDKGADKAMIDFVRKGLIEDGIWGQEEGKELVRGYHFDWGRKFKALADQYVTGAYDAKSKSLLGSYTLGKMLGFLHTWFEARYTNAFQKEGVGIEELSDYIPVKDIHGHWTAEQQRLGTEGYITTVFALGTHLLTGNIKDYKMTPVRKANFVKYATAVIGYLAIQTLYSIFVEQGKDDKRKLAVIPDWRIVRNVKYGVQSLLTIPTLIEILWNPFPAFDIISGWVTDPMGRLTVGNVPFKTQVKTLVEPMKAIMEDMELLDDGEINRQTTNK